MTRSEMALARRAIGLRWPITEAMRKSLVQFAAKTVTGRARIRDKIAAAKLLIDADKVNVAEIAAMKKGDAPPPSPTFGALVAVHVQNNPNLADQLIDRLLCHGREQPAGSGIALDGPALPSGAAPPSAES